MKGDFTRDTFDPRNHFSRVLLQQGRAQLDADWNEQVAILLHYMQTLATDLIGPHGGPKDILDAAAMKTTKVNCGFEIVATADRIDDLSELQTDNQAADVKSLLAKSKPALLLGKGRYYVDGILCENLGYMAYSAQQGYPFPGQPTQFNAGQSYLLYLDVWERHMTYVEVEDADGKAISIREAALNGPDTATRAQVVWQIKAKPGVVTAPDDKTWNQFVNEWQPSNRGWLKACAIKPGTSDAENPCITRPDSRYRGAENQLYRVEIHKGGSAQDRATFKWSRENGSVIFPIRQLGALKVTLETLGRDAHLGLLPGDWVEIVDDDYTLQNRAEPLIQVEAIDPDTHILTLKDAPASQVGQDPSKHPFLRRWDQGEAANSHPLKDGVLIVEGDNDLSWIELEDGVQIQFHAAPDAIYCTGDYWLIPTRTATGDVEWPGAAGTPEAKQPDGSKHHYAPLWIISVSLAGAVTADPANDLRLHF